MKKNIFFGISLTITSKNYDTITSKYFVDDILDSGCKLFFYVECVPVKEGTEELILTLL